jgi:hypothetical protein
VAEPELTPEEVVARLRRLDVADVVVSACSTLAQLAFAKLEPATRDLAQARLAIESLRVLLPLLDGEAEPDLLRDLRQVLANLQLVYAETAQEQVEAPTPGDTQAQTAEEAAAEPDGDG